MQIIDKEIFALTENERKTQFLSSLTYFKTRIKELNKWIEFNENQLLSMINALQSNFHHKKD